MNDVLNQLPSFKKRSLLVVEDSDADFDALKRLLTKMGFSNPIYRAEDGEDAIDFIFHLGEYKDEEIAPKPTLVLLDLNLPGTDGREVLAKVKEDENLKAIPIIIFTTSPNPKDVETCYKWGANSYMLKPMKMSDLQASLETFIVHWFEVVLLP